jgi:hypothetical protein
MRWKNWCGFTCNGPFKQKYHYNKTMSFSVNLVNAFLNTIRIRNVEEASRFAVNNDCMLLLDWLYENKLIDLVGIICQAKNTKMLLWVLNKFNNCQYTGKLQLDDYVKTFRLNCNHNGMLHCSKNGWLKGLIILHKNKHLIHGCFTKTVEIASANGHLDIIRWVYSGVGCMFCAKYSTYFAVDMAAKNNHLKVVQWLCKHTKLKPSIYGFEQSAACGNLDMLEWLYEYAKQSVDLTSCLQYASSKGHTHVVKWILKHNAKVTSTAIHEAAVAGHLDVLDILYSYREGSVESLGTIHDALENGHLDVVNYMLKHDDYITDIADSYWRVQLYL